MPRIKPKLTVIQETVIEAISENLKYLEAHPEITEGKTVEDTLNAIRFLRLNNVSWKQMRLDQENPRFPASIDSRLFACKKLDSTTLCCSEPPPNDWAINIDGALRCIPALNKTSFLECPFRERRRF